jgi:selenocysteine-specific elongation factor
MKNYMTVGVAGHVDHGKTAFVKVLTGIDTDRNPEEKRRGLSIESGIASWCPFPDVGIALIDVPGHVDFLKNAIRGLNSVDLAILVVAADDGVMPQTYEHLDILQYFGARGGLVVLSKTDLVDRETVDIAKMELQDILQKTFLQGKPILEFSIKHPLDRASLTQFLREEIDGCRHESAEAPFRLWIDQVRQLTGIGTVVSGTVLTGSVQAGDDLEILPAGLLSRARSLESHGRKITSAAGGQRVGINLPKISLAAIAKGMALAHPHTMLGSHMFNAALRMRSRAPMPLKNRQKVKLYIGTAVIQATVLLIGATRLRPGQNSLIQLRLSQSLCAAPGDAFVVAPLNRNLVLGGGIVLEPTRQKYRSAKREAIVPFLEALQAHDLPACVDIILEKNGDRLLTARDLAAVTHFAHLPIESEMNARVQRRELIYFKGRGAIKRSHFEHLRKQALASVGSALRKDPFHTGLSATGIKDGLAPAIDPTLLAAVLDDLIMSGELEETGGRYRLPTAQAALDDHRTMLQDRILAYIQTTGICPFSSDTARQACQMAVETSEVRQILNYFTRQKQLIRLTNGRYLTPAALATIKVRVQRAIDDRGTMRLSDSKNVLGYGRMGAAPVLDYLDHIGFTIRNGNERMLKESIGSETAIL